MRRTAVLVVAWAIFAWSVAVSAQHGRPLRVASLAPARSVWDNGLQQMRADWERSTQGRVRAIVYPSGQQGDEGAVLLKLQSGTLDAAALLLSGLCLIDPAFNILGIPLFFESYEELNHVTGKLTPLLKERLEARGYVLLHWGHAGWIRVFSTRPAKTLDDLKALKMYTTAGDDEMVRVYQRHGFRPIALSPTGILTALTSGMIEALPTTPTAMLFFQWYSRARYMLDVPLAPLVGATVITQRTWQAIGESDRSAMLKAAAAAESRLAREIPKQDEESIAVMRGKGLTVVRGQGSEWTHEAQRFADDMKGMVPDDLFAVALRERDAFRSRQASTAR
jgi:TRAP-type C4-dicarboxylate transport system substrate-binding protein